MNRLRKSALLLSILLAVAATVPALPNVYAFATINLGAVLLAESMQTEVDAATALAPVVRRLETILTQESSDTHLRYLVGVSHLVMEETESGLGHLTRATEAGNQYAQYALGQWYLDDGNLILALHYLDESICKSYHCTNELAHELYEGGHREDAIGVIESYLQQSPKNAAAHYQLATMSWGSGNREKTIRAIEDALHYDEAKTSLKYRYHQARLAYLIEDYTRAESLLARLLDDYPNDFATNYLLGLTLSQVDDWPLAEAALATAVEIDSSHPGVRVNLARALRAQEKPEQAIEHYLAAIASVDSPSRMIVFLNELAGLYNELDSMCHAINTQKLITDIAAEPDLDIVAALVDLDQHCKE